jgi:hypothetical protein
MNRRQTLSMILLTPTWLAGAAASSIGAELAPLPAPGVVRPEIALAINSASASGWSASMSRTNLLPTFIDSPQSPPLLQPKSDKR